MSVNPLARLKIELDESVNILQTTTNFGVVHPLSQDFSRQFQRIQTITGLSQILAPRLAFNTKVTPIDTDVLETQKTHGFIRTREPSDGVIVDITGQTLNAVMIMNADCGVIQILAPDGRLAVLHGGLDNVDNKDGSSIVTNAIEYFTNAGIQPSDLRFRIGEAALNCCYGLNDPKYAENNKARADRISNLYGEGIVSPVKNPPRNNNNGIGFNVPLLAARQAEKAGIKNIEIEKICTSCAGLTAATMAIPERSGTFYSNLRQDQDTVTRNGFGARNAVVVYPNS